jgi:hypothetical protein
MVPALGPLPEGKESKIPMRAVKKIVFPELGNMLFGRRMSSALASHGFVMFCWPEAGVVSIKDPREGEEVLIHMSRCEVYLEQEMAAPAPEPAKPSKATGGGSPPVR